MNETSEGLGAVAFMRLPPRRCFNQINWIMPSSPSAEIPESLVPDKGEVKLITVNTRQLGTDGAGQCVTDGH